MDIELTEMEHGKPLTLSSLAGDKNAKIKELKVKKNYAELYELAVSLPPTKDKFLLKASALMHLKKWEEAIETCDRGLDLEEDSEFYNMKGRALGKLGNMKEKVALTRRAVELDPNIPAYYRNLGAGLYKLKLYDEAISNHEKAINLEPTNSLNYHNVGAALFRLEQYEKAKQYFKQAVERNKKEGLSHSWLGDCYKKTGELKEAMECYEKAYEVSGKEMYREERDRLDKELNPKKGFFAKLFG